MLGRQFDGPDVIGQSQLGGLQGFGHGRGQTLGPVGNHRLGGMQLRPALADIVHPDATCRQQQRGPALGLFQQSQEQLLGLDRVGRIASCPAGSKCQCSLCARSQFIVLHNSTFAPERSSVKGLPIPTCGGFGLSGRQIRYKRPLATR